MNVDIDTAVALPVRLAAAKNAARAAGKALLAHYAALDRLNIEQKGVNDYVSNADREAEDIIAGLLRPQFPEDGFLGEETGLSGAVNAATIWCVDPLDGTTNFLKGAHNWCVSIGLYSHSTPVLGVIYDPLRDEMFSAAAGMGADVNGRRLAVTQIAGLHQASLGLGHNARVTVADFAADTAILLATGAGFRQVGAGALMLAYVAAGRVDCYYERHMLPWDAMAGLALITEAGGLITPYPGDGLSVVQGGPVLASGPALFPRLMNALSLT